MPPTRQTNATKSVALKDLPAADRERLLAEARGEIKANVDAAQEAEEIVAKQRDGAIAELIDDREHAKGCPGGRVEAYANTKPAKPQDGIAAKPVTVVHCLECGATTVIEQPYEQTMREVVARLEESLEADEAGAEVKA